MEKNFYLGTKSQKKKKALKGVWFIVAIAAVFIFVLLRFVHNSEGRIGSRNLPEREDAYSMAKVFLKGEFQSSQQIDFSDDGFSYGKKSDSVYVIKSSYKQTLETGGTKDGNFSVTMRFKGGNIDDQGSWDVLSINKD